MGLRCAHDRGHRRVLAPRARGSGPSREPQATMMIGRSTAVLALALAAALTMTSLADVAGASYRVDRSKLADLCADALPWTDQAPLPFPARKPRDAFGVPVVIIDGERYYRPGVLAINGMKRLDAYRDGGDVRQLQQALLQAERLRELSLTRRGADWLPFWYDYPPARQQAPWFNAMVQGLVLSFYVRLGDMTGDPVHMAAAHRVFRSFLREGTDRRPWIAYVDGKGFLWLEHYPERNPSHVLNAHLHALFGIYEYWQATRSVEARRVLQGAITTMRSNAVRYRRPGRLSLYDLTHGTSFPKYHAAHVWQLHLLARISGEESFARLARQLAADRRPTSEVPGRPARHGSRVVGPRCRPAGRGDMVATRVPQ